MLFHRRPSGILVPGTDRPQLRIFDPANQPPAASWPDWTDAERWELGADPSEADRAWWNENAPGRDDHIEVIEPCPSS